MTDKYLKGMQGIYTWNATEFNLMLRFVLLNNTNSNGISGDVV